MNQHAPVTFGQSEGSIETGGFRVTEAAYERNLRLPRHEHPFPSWTAVLAGGFEERFRDGDRACASGAVLAKPGHAAHSNVYGDAGARVVIVEITGAAIDAHPELHGVTESTIRLIPASAVAAMRDGSVIVDLAAEAGGNCELTSPGEEVVREGVTLVGFTNVPSLMAADASRLYSRNVAALLQHLAPEARLVLDFEDEITAGACVARPTGAAT